MGIIDSLAGYEALPGSELPPPERLAFRRSSATPAPSSQGVAVAEIVHHVATMAILYLAQVQTVAEVAAAVDWLLAEGAQVINMSLVGELRQQLRQQAPGGPRPRRRRRWPAGVRSRPGGGLSVPRDRLRAPLRRGPALGRCQGGACSDYALLVYWDDAASGRRQLAADVPQDCSPGAQPLEVMAGSARPADGTVRISVRKGRGGPPRRLELFVLGGPLSPSVPEGSIVPTADSPAALAVGAVPAHDPSRIEPYSSRGPGPGGAIKPDLVGPDVVSTATYGPHGFAGTSASAPHVAGLAAALKAALPQLNLRGLRDLVLSSAQEPRAAGRRLLLRVWPCPPAAPSAAGRGAAATLPSLPGSHLAHRGGEGGGHDHLAAAPGGTRYRLQGALGPSFSFGASVIEFPAGPYNLLVVGAPTWDGGVFYYRLAACNDQGEQPWSPPLALGRRIWPGPEHWNFMAGGFSFLGTTYLWAVNSSPVSGKASDLLL